MSRTVAIVQARTGSVRLPGKSLLHLRGYALLDWVLVRLARCRRLDEVVLAIPEGFPDDLLAERAPSSVRVVRGPESDLVARFRMAAAASDADTIVRVCADSPLVCPELVDELVERFAESGADYGWNHVPRGNLFPDALGAEICTRDLLELLDRDAVPGAEREHVFNHVLARPDRFATFTYDPDDPVLRRPDLRFDIDTWEDYAKLSRLPLDPGCTATEIVRAQEGNPPCA